MASEFMQWIEKATQAEMAAPASFEVRCRMTGRVYRRVDADEFELRRQANWNRPGGVCEADNVEVVRVETRIVATSARRARKAA